MICPWFHFAAILLLAVVSQLGAAKSNGPEIASKVLDALPGVPFYFKNSDTVLFQNLETREVYRSRDGGVEWDVIKDEDGETLVAARWIELHPWDKQKAYIVGEKSGLYWVTTDQGETWRRFQSNGGPSLIKSDPYIFSFHGKDSSKVILHQAECAGYHCIEVAFYTVDDFKTIAPLRQNSNGCLWAVGTPQFAPDVVDEFSDRTFCIVHGLKSFFPDDWRLVQSDDFFSDNDDGLEVKLNNGRPISGVNNMASVKKFLVAAAKSQGTDELAMFVTDDSQEWHRAEFGNHKIEQDAYTVLESTNYSIQIDVMNTNREVRMGVLFTSNSNGTYFTRNIEHTNRDERGIIDFEKIEDVQGIVLVNVVDNWEEVEKKHGKDRKVVSKITFDDGRTFQPLTVKDDHLHLHSVTNERNLGRVFSSPAPGIVMGVGNTGSHLKSYEHGDLYVSDDAGLTWHKGLDKPHKYEFGNKGAIIMAIKDDGKPTKKIQFSINHGKEWETAELPNEIIPYLLTTTPDSTSFKFLLVGSDKKQWYVFSIDFNGLHERKCEENDLEKWPARLNEEGEPDCLMGHKQFYYRRRSDANCFITENLFQDANPIFEPCTCTAEDFECDYNFVRSEDGKECKPAVPLETPAGECKSDDATFKGPSGWRLIPGNACLREGGEQLDKEIDRSCKEATKTPSNDAAEITSQITTFEAEAFGQHFYLERVSSSGGHDETIVMRTIDSKAWLTRDHGKTWERILKDGAKIQEIVRHQYINDVAYFLTDDEKQYFTVNRGDTFASFSAPAMRNLNGEPTLFFHSKFKDYLIWTGPDNCKKSHCPKNAYITKHRGDNWDILARVVEKCEFMAREDRKDSDKLVFCDQYENEEPENRRVLTRSVDNFFATFDTPVTDIVRFATMSEFIIVAAHNPDNPDSLKADISVDGKEFADAEFPYNFNIPVQEAYTVLDSSSHSIFLHVTVNIKEGQQYGSIIKSNSNGTSYVLSISGVNLNEYGYADFEKMQGLEGVLLVNVVDNIEGVDKGDEKRLRTMITHNDGSEWQALPAPAKDSEGNAYNCGANCALHLHGYTERSDPRATYASASAVGLMFGVGNVGEALGSKADGSTFFTKDAGITWKEVKKGVYMWEYGDQGSILVLVEELKPTRVIYFSMDEGETWEEYQFSDKDVTVSRLTTVPSDTSKNFLLWGRLSDSNGLVTVNIDFSKLRDRSCTLDEASGESKDFYLWQPKHPSQKENCLFGHVEQYHRKNPSAQCWNDWSDPHVHSIAHNCSCTREDYECDYNYERQSDGSCELVDGLPKPDAVQYCRDNPDAVEYWEPTGYRLIPLTTCTGGQDLVRLVPKPCPSHEEEFERKHGVSGSVIFFAIIVPIAIAGAAGYWVFTRWDGKFGQIRLGDGGDSAAAVFLSRDSPLISIPVTIIAGIVATVRVLPLLAMSLWRSVSGYVRVPGRGPRPYATRGAFAARRGDYTNVVDDEDELLGNDDFEDEEEA